MKHSYMGQPMERREDSRLLRGRGEFLDDIELPDVLFAVFLRSPVAHGRIVSIEVSAALERPGVKAD